MGSTTQILERGWNLFKFGNSRLSWCGLLCDYFSFSCNLLELTLIKERDTSLCLQVGVPVFLESLGGLLALLLDFYASHSLSIPKTMFEQKNAHQ